MRVHVHVCAGLRNSQTLSGLDTYDINPAKSSEHDRPGRQFAFHGQRGRYGELWVERDTLCKKRSAPSIDDFCRTISKKLSSTGWRLSSKLTYFCQMWTKLVQNFFFSTTNLTHTVCIVFSEENHLFEHYIYEKPYSRETDMNTKSNEQSALEY